MPSEHHASVSQERPSISLQRRLLTYVLICAPLVWTVALGVSSVRARGEVNELFDTEMIRLARQVQATLVGLQPTQQVLPPPELSGEADLQDLALAVWNAQGQVLLVDREGVQLPRQADRSGFVDMTLDGEEWRVYYLQAPRGEWLIAAGQKTHERDELVLNLVGSQLLPWLLVLPVLLLALAWAVRQALIPVRAVAQDLSARASDDLAPVALEPAPAELQPLLRAMNGLFARVEHTLARERRFTADAAHELRTPLAVLAAQWEVMQGASSEEERRAAAKKLGAGISRMSRVVEQMLGMARLDATDALPLTKPLDWQALVEQTMGDVLPLAERRNIELSALWPQAPATPPAWLADADLMGMLLRNLLDNAVRYATQGSTVVLRMEPDRLAVENEGPPLTAAQLQGLGERFQRSEGQTESGSGLGVSIARRIAILHGLELRHLAHSHGQGVIAELMRSPSTPSKDSI
jgi:two-component system sensor histidine kinase QseC